MKVKHPVPISKKWALWEWADIPSKIDPGFVYLRRLRVIQTPWFSVFLHWINEADSDRDPHDHPWTFWSWILRGGYVEQVFYPNVGASEPFVWGRWTRHRMDRDLAHQILSVGDRTVTAILAGPRRQVWGFHTPDGWVEWREYLRSTEPEYFTEGGSDV